MGDQDLTIGCRNHPTAGAQLVPSKPVLDRKSGVLRKNKHARMLACKKCGKWLSWVSAPANEAETEERRAQILSWMALGLFKTEEDYRRAIASYMPKRMHGFVDLERWVALQEEVSGRVEDVEVI